MPACSYDVLTEWHGAHKDWYILRVKACVPICDQGNTWSTWCACVTMFFVRHDAHNGCLDNCILRRVAHWRVLYLSIVSFRSVVRLFTNFLALIPPCSIHHWLHLLLVFLHPNIAHLV